MSLKLRIFLIYAIGWIGGSIASFLVARDWDWEVLALVAIAGVWFTGRALSKIIGEYDA